MTAAEERDNRNRAIIQQACWQALAHLDGLNSGKAEEVLLKAWTQVSADMEQTIIQQRKTIEGLVNKQKALAKRRAEAKKPKGKTDEVERKEGRGVVQGRPQGAGTSA